MASSLLTVISGGQTGADQGALFAARKLGIKTGGFAPKDYRTLDGRAEWLKDYGLVESSSRNYVTRSIENVDHSDVTIAFRNHHSTGTDKTIGYAITKKWQTIPLTDLTTSYKPVFVVSDVSSEDQLLKTIEFIRFHKPSVINVCGHRETDHIRKLWTLSVSNFLERVFDKIK